MNELFVMGAFGAINTLGLCGLIAALHKRYDQVIQPLVVCLVGNLVGAFCL